MRYEAKRKAGHLGFGRIAAVLLVGMGIGSCNRSAPPSSDQRPNILLIVVDTLRADKLGCHGSALGLTPHLDVVARESTRFERAFAHAPWTLPSFASMLTSTYPAQHGAGIRNGEYTKLGPTARTLAECFREADYATGAVVNVDFLTAPFGLDQGYAEDDYDAYGQPDNTQMRKATVTTDVALRWLRKHRTRPFFMLVHYFDPHLVYDPPAEFRRKFARPEDRENLAWSWGTRADLLALRTGKATLDLPAIRRAEALYNGEVAYADAEVGRLLTELDRLGLTDSTILVITADHGEEFLDHGGFEHGHTLYDELLHVPLMLRYPRRLPVKTVSTTVGQIDLAPTLCELARVPLEPTFVGRSLLPLIDGSEPEDHPVLAQSNFWGPAIHSWRRGGYKVIFTPRRVELYEMASDPLERNNLALKEPVLCESMLKDFRLVLQTATTRPQKSQTVTLSPAEFERLQALGYLTGMKDASQESATQPVTLPAEAGDR
ncbi:MAG: sulfatase [Planctomycetota bacterium]